MSNEENDSLATLEVQRVILHAEAFENDDAVPKDYVLSQVDNEMKRAQEAEGLLQTSIETESARAQAKESQLETALETETARAQAKESQLETSIETESSRAQLKEGQIETSLSTESARAQAKEGELESSILSEATRAQAKESELEGAIASETARAQDVESGKANLSGADFSGVVKMFEYLHFGENWRVKASVDGARIVFQHKKANGDWKNAVPFICSV